MSNHINRFMCLVYIVRYMDHLQVAGLLCTLVQNCTEDSSSVSLFQGLEIPGAISKSSDDVIGAIVLFTVPSCKIKNVLFFCVCFHGLFM